jgi:Helix-turn-helix domain
MIDLGRETIMSSRCHAQSLPKLAENIYLCLRRLEHNQMSDAILEGLTNPESVVVPFPAQSKDGKRKWDQMWGKSVINYGYVALPRLLLDGQRRLGLSATQTLVLIHLANQWWEPGRNPWPSKARLANLLGLSARQVQRILGELEMAGFICRVSRFRGNKGQTSNEFDLSGLVEKLKKLEPEFSAVRKEASENRAKVQRRGGLKVSS